MTRPFPILASWDALSCVLFTKSCNNRDVVYCSRCLSLTPHRPRLTFSSDDSLQLTEWLSGARRASSTAARDTYHFVLVTNEANSQIRANVSAYVGRNLFSETVTLTSAFTIFLQLTSIISTTTYMMSVNSNAGITAIVVISISTIIQILTKLSSD